LDYYPLIYLKKKLTLITNILSKIKLNYQSSMSFKMILTLESNPVICQFHNIASE